MSTLSSIIGDIWEDISEMIYPKRCLVCREPLHQLRTKICAKCFGKISLTRYWERSENVMAEHARDMQPMIVECSAMLFYDSYCRDMIHRLKYHRQWGEARYLGELMGAYLSRSELYSTIDVVIAVPLHPIRTFERTYNQAEYIALGVAEKMSLPVNFHALYRRRHTTPQAKKSNMERWSDGEGLFNVRREDSLRGKHILLIDDVYTTGATIFRCVEALVREVPGCRISVATVATSRRNGG